MGQPWMRHLQHPFADSSPDVWYSFIGSGTNTAASLCGEETTFDTYIEIFQGDGEVCDQAMLVTDNDDFCGRASEVHWFAESGVTYYIRVSGFIDTAVGQFGLTLYYP